MRLRLEKVFFLAEFDSQHGSEFSFLFPTSILSYPVGLSIELRHPISEIWLHSQPILILEKRCFWCISRGCLADFYNVLRPLFKILFEDKHRCLRSGDRMLQC